MDTIALAPASLAKNDPTQAEPMSFLGKVHDTMSRMDKSTHLAAGEELLSTPALLLAHLRAYYLPPRVELLRYLSIVTVSCRLRRIDSGGHGGRTCAYFGKYTINQHY